MSRVMCIWFPDWAIQYRLRQAPAQHGSPADRFSSDNPRSATQAPVLPSAQALVLYDVDAKRGPRVTACSSAARQAGVRRQAPLADARTLLEHYQARQEAQAGREARVHIRIEPQDAAADRIQLRQLARKFQSFSPLVGLEPADHPECLYLDITGCAHLFDGEQGLSGRIIWELHQQQLFAHIATADTLGAAWAITHQQAGLRRPSRHMRSPSAASPTTAPQTTASQTTAPGNPARRAFPTFTTLTLASIVESGHEAAALQDLPVEALRLPATTINRLHEFDLRSIRQIEQLPRDTLPSRFGKQLLERLDQALGRLPEPIQPEDFPPTIHSHWMFEEASTRMSEIQYVLEHLLSDLVQQAREQQLGLLQFEFRIQQADRQRQNIRIGLASASLCSDHLLELLRVHIEQLRLTAAVDRIECRALQTVPMELRQRQLFDEDLSASEQRQQLAVFIDRLSNRLGADRVVRPRLLPDHQPEKAVCYQPLIAHAATSQSAAGQPAEAWYPPSHLPPRPILLDPHPRPLIVQTGPDLKPCAIQEDQRWSRIDTCWGPERIRTGWWRQDMIQRDYYRVQLSDGRLLWLFCTPDQGGWFCHGAFD